MPNRPTAVLLYSLLTIVALAQLASAIYITPIFSGTSAACNQTSANLISCQDGKPITVAFSVSAPYAPIYGTFTAYPTDYANETFPIDFYGSLCTISSSSTKTCFLTLNPISPFQGNGTVAKTISIKFVSSNYPQISFTNSFNITIVHTATPETSALVSLYDSVNGTYNSMSNVYYSRCTSYDVCWANLSGTLQATHAQLANASSQVLHSRLDAAYYNISIANRSITSMNPTYDLYVNISNRIINNVVKANYLISNATALYYNDTKQLSNCTFANGTSYDSYVSNSLAPLRTYPMLNTVSGSTGYLNLATNVSSKEDALVRACISAKPILPKISIEAPSGATRYLEYVGVIAIVAFAIYMLLRANEFKADSKWLESKLERKMAEQPRLPEEAKSDAPLGADVPSASTSATESAPAPKQTWVAEEEKKLEDEMASLEDSFDKWLSEHIGKHEEDSTSHKDN